ncbi:hypothetical protein EV421DRAFT_1744652 [Armillaria borealis]|uniref:Uncharacterized protein n=1 Tax=Armillaria borealis TaxID=47425 RepID=A0AA39IT38_9AGAR|nr:hypothetical protein EV421DRAFT_1744652 [Armillaria borealis]
MEASGAVAHGRVVFPHTNNGGYTTLGCVGHVGGVGEGVVGFGRGGQQQASKSLYGRNSCGINGAQGSSFDVQNGVFVVAVVQYRCPDLYPAIPLDVSCPPRSSISPSGALPRSRNPPVPVVVILVMLDVAVLVNSCAEVIGPDVDVDAAGAVGLAYTGGGGEDVGYPGLLGLPDAQERPKIK